MGTKNENLCKILDFYYALDNNDKRTLLNEMEVLHLVEQHGKLNLDNVVINCKLNIKNILQYAAKQNIVIDNIRITNCTLLKGISFYDTEILGNLYFWENICESSEFSKCKVNGYSYFSNTIFRGITSFNQAFFVRDTFFWGVEFMQEAYFRECVFSGQVDLWCAEFKDTVDFNYSRFNKDADFSNCFFRNKVLFQNTVWGENKQEASKIVLDNINCKGLVSFNGANFRSVLSISYALFSSRIEFEKCSFGDTITSEYSIFTSVSFSYSHFYSPIYLNNIRGKKIELLFTNIWSDSLMSVSCYTNKQKNSLLDYISFDKSIFSKHSIVIIEGLFVKKDVFKCNYCNILGMFSIYNSDIDSFEMKSSSIIGSLILKDTNIKDIDLTNSTSTGKMITNSNVCFRPVNRETAYLLRHEKEKEGDIVMALKYREIEMKIYNKEFEMYSFKKKLSNIDEITIMKLNYWSNDYGQSWMKGILFTFFTSFIFTFALMLLTQDLVFYGGMKDLFLFNVHFWIEVLNFLWLPSTFLDDFQSKGLLYTLICLIGKIMVAFGIFQTAASFRKYSKA